MDSKKIKIATCIPSHNDEKYIVESVKSVLDQNLNSNIQNVIFITFNNSSDSSLKELENKILLNPKYENRPIFVDHQSKYQGTSPTRNNLLQQIFWFEKQMSTNIDYIAYNDADDVWIDQNKLQKQIDYLESTTETDILGTQYIGRIKGIETAPENYLLLDRRPLDHDSCLEWLFRGLNPIGNASVLYRRNILFKIGMYEDLFPLTEDMWFWYKAVLAGFKLSNLEDNCLLYNISNNPNYSSEYPLALSNMFQLIIKTRNNVQFSKTAKKQ
jgi:glycosyltransferase involved in cell wall biosynthesis